MAHDSSGRRRFLKSSGAAAAGIGTAGLAGCIGGLTGGGGTPELGLAFVVPVENVGSLFAIEEIQQQMSNLGDAYELRVTRNSSTPDSLNAMAAGEVDMALLTTVSYASAVRQEAVPGNIQIIATDFWDAHPEFFGFTIFSNNGSGIQRAEDLSGKKLGVNATGTGVQAVFVKQLRQVGIDPQDDVQFVELDFPAFTSAIKDGRIDAGIYPALFAVEARQEEFTEVFSSQDAWQQEYPFAYLTASVDSANQNTEAMNAFGQDYMSVINYINQNRSQVVSLAAQQFELPESVVDSFFLTERDYYREDVRVNFERLQAAMDEMAELGFIEQSFNVQEYATNEYLPSGSGSQ